MQFGGLNNKKNVAEHCTNRKMPWAILVLKG